MSFSKSALIETAALQARLEEPQCKILDASYHIPPSTRQAQLEYEAVRIPGALFFDIDAIADQKSNLPHMLPGPDEFEGHMRLLGIDSGDTVVVYDSQGLFSAPRAWWMLRYFGHERVYVLNGGLPKWVTENRPLENGLPKPKVEGNAQNGRFKARVQPLLLCPLDTLQAAVSDSLKIQAPRLPFQILDMRSAGRFQGKEPEPRAGLKGGHIPGSLNAPWGAWLNPDQTLLSPAALAARCQQIGLDWAAPTVSTCGSGLTACIGALALYELGNAASAVYDGSWAEWGALAESPVAPMASSD
jgi:thiosulfate/3-mercaptopyruvate sulfurtransferase